MPSGFLVLGVFCFVFAIHSLLLDTGSLKVEYQPTLISYLHSNNLRKI